MSGIGAQYYHDIYILLVLLLSVFVFDQYSQYSQSRIQNSEQPVSLGVIILTLFFALFIGLRPVSGKYFMDMAGYYIYYNHIKGTAFSFNWNVDNKLFDNYIALLASKNISSETFFLSMAFLYFGGIAWSCSKLFPRDKMAAFLVYLGAFSTFSYGTNGLKAGVAASFFLVALSMHENRRWFWTFLFLLLSLGFHHSMILPIAAFIVCLFVNNPKWFFRFWALCFLMALFHVSFFQFLFARFIDEHSAGYLLGAGETVRRDLMGGFRIDFILYSAIPVIIGWMAVYKKRIVSKRYFFLLNLYTFINAIWMLCMYAEFTNRISYLSWLMLPIVLIYPFLNEIWSKTQYKTFRIVAYGHLVFTMFMAYVYYN